MKALWLKVVIAALAFAASPPDQERDLREAIWGGRWLEGLRRYTALEHAGIRPGPQASYLAGWAEWMLRRPEEARPLVAKAVQAKFRASGGRIQPEELLARIDQYTTIKPPAVEVSGLDRARIEPFADARTDRTAPVLEALPRILAIGRQVFGEPPPVRFFLFARKPALVRFYGLFQPPNAVSNSEPHSTGGVNMVIYCEEKAHRATEAETLSLALHETTHAWIATYLRTRYDRVVNLPKYLDEGLAVYVASLWSEDVHRLSSERFAIWRKIHPGSPPTFEALASSPRFYEPESVSLNYLLAHLLIERLLGPPKSGATKIPTLLDALARSDDDARAWRDVTGKNVAQEYQALVNELWR